MIRVATFVIAMTFRVVLGFLAVELLRIQAAILYTIIDNILAIIAIAYIIIRKNNPYSIKWVAIILLLPVFGLFLYLFFSRLDSAGVRNKRLRASVEYGNKFLENNPNIISEIKEIHPNRSRLSHLLEVKNYPAYNNTSCKYFNLGEEHFESMLRDLEAAEKFIFMEYFTVNVGGLWSKIRDVLIKKANSGVDVRLMIDDMGSIFTFPSRMIKELRRNNIKVARFNDVNGFYSTFYFNYRSHKKITVIDGNIGYTGGSNISDEYINAYPKHGHWKDTAIRMEGAAVWGLTVSFLQLWDFENNITSDYESCRPQVLGESNGYFQPFMDGPSDNDNLAKNVYKSFINNAVDYIYITTPYLIVDSNMLNALCVAAESGVDVRIILPKVWDKWYVHLVSQSNYLELLKAGVKVYEYAPGYIHAKMVISDDEHALVGTINMDYRSFYLHYENSVWICGSSILGDIKQDMLNTIAVCEEILLEDWANRPLRQKIIQNTLRIFAVLF